MDDNLHRSIFRQQLHTPDVTPHDHDSTRARDRAGRFTLIEHYSLFGSYISFSFSVTVCNIDSEIAVAKRWSQRYFRRWRQTGCSFAWLCQAASALLIPLLPHPLHSHITHAHTRTRRSKPAFFPRLTVCLEGRQCVSRWQHSSNQQQYHCAPQRHIDPLDGAAFALSLPNPHTLSVSRLGHTISITQTHTQLPAALLKGCPPQLVLSLLIKACSRCSL